MTLGLAAYQCKTRHNGSGHPPFGMTNAKRTHASAVLVGQKSAVRYDALPRRISTSVPYRSPLCSRGSYPRGCHCLKKRLDTQQALT